MLQNTPTDLNLHVTLLGKELRPGVSAKDREVYMDVTLSFDERIISVTSSCLSSLSQMIFSVMDAIYAIAYIEAWKGQDFNGVWTRDLAIPLRRSIQLSYAATDVASWSFVGSNVPVRNVKWYTKCFIAYLISQPQFYKWNISYIISHSSRTH